MFCLDESFPLQNYITDKVVKYRNILMLHDILLGYLKSKDCDKIVGYSLILQFRIL